MNIVLAGGSGFLGRHLLSAFAARGHSCAVLTRNPERCRELRLWPGVSLVRVRKYEPEPLKECLDGADAAVNLIGILNESGRDGSGFRKVHVELVESLLDACKAANVKRLLHVSALHAGTKDPSASHYLKTKGEAEEIILASGIDSTIVQPSVIFGVGDSFFNRFATLLRFMPILPLACPGARMQPVWAGDVAEAMARMLENPEFVGRRCPLVGPKSYSLIELVRFTARAIGKKRWVVGLPDGVSRLQAMICDFVPGKPFSTDNYRSLQIDNTSEENALWSLGIEPRSLEGLVRSYLAGTSHQRRLNAIRKRTGHRP